MLLLRDASIRLKLSLIVMATVGLALVLASLAFVSYEFLGYRRSLVRELNMMGNLVEAGSGTALSFEDGAMCAQAMALARVRRVYFGAYDPKGGGVEHGARVFSHPTCNHRPEVYGGIRETEAQGLLRAFFRDLR